jgi:hypothetical protein
MALIQVFGYIGRTQFCVLGFNRVVLTVKFVPNRGNANALFLDFKTALSCASP